MSIFTRDAASYRPKQQGLALVVVLLFLVAITSIAVLAARKAMLDEGTG
jgi:Tfp pilus assembly protein PilX